MRAEVYLKWQDVPEDALEGRRCVVIDVLRATSTVCRALAAGAKEVRAFGEVEKLLLAAQGCVPVKTCI